MANILNLDKIESSTQYDLRQILDNNDTQYVEDDIFKLSLNSCNYFDPHDVSQLIKDPALESNVFSTFSINCRGLNSNLDNFKSLVSDISSSRFAFDIIGLTELHQILGTINYDIDGYHELEKKTRANGGKGGVGFYVKNTIQYKPRLDISVFIPHIIETYFIEINLRHQNIICGIIYRPNTLPCLKDSILSFQTLPGK